MTIVRLTTILFASSWTWGQGQNTRSDLRRDQVLGSVSGRVIDADSGSDCSGLEVRAGKLRVKTDDRGLYKISGLALGPTEIFIPSGNMTGSLAARTISVLAAKEVTGVDLHVRLPGAIGGRVRDSDGSPLIGVRVSLIGKDTDHSREWVGKRTTQFVRRGGARTDDRGYFEFKRVLSGVPLWIMYEPEPTYDAGHPPDESTPKKVPTLTYYPSAPSLVSAVAITIRSQEMRSDANITVARSDATCLRLKFVTGEHSNRFRFGVHPIENRVRINQQTGLPTLGGLTDLDGLGQTCALYDGEFEITGAIIPSTAVSPTHFGRLSVRVHSEGSNSSIVNVDPNVVIQGEVAWEGGVPQDTSISQEITLVPVPQSEVNKYRVRVPGAFSFPAMPSTEYSLLLQGMGPSVYVKQVLVGQVSALHSPIIPSSSGALSGVRIVLAHDAATVSFSVVDQNGLPAVDCWVSLLTVEDTNDSVQSLRLFFGKTDNNGFYTTERIVPPDRYYTIATRSHPGTGEDARQLIAPIFSQLQKIDVRPSGQMTIRLSPIDLK